MATTKRHYTKRPLAERFWAKVDKTEGCWLWTGSLLHNGYGSFGVDGQCRRAHRFAYELTVGPIPEGLHVDHTCRNRNCVRPDHMRLVTNKQNQENRSRRTNSRTGIRGVFFEAGAWRGKVVHNGQQIYVGRFSSPTTAEAAVIAKRLELHTHNDLDRQ